MGGKQALFEEDEEQQPQLQVNAQYAKRFEHNKKREELHRLKDKYPEVAAKLEAKERAWQQVAAVGGEDEESEEEEDNGVIPERTEAQIFETLLKIRRKDPAVYDVSAKFYSSSSEGEGEEDDDDGALAGSKGRRRERPMYLKDVLFQQAMEGADGSSEEEEGEGGGAAHRPHTYADEQQDLKRAFLEAVDEVVVEDGGAAAGGPKGEFGGVLKPRAKRAKQAAAAPAGQDASDSEDEGQAATAAAAAAEGPGGAAGEARVQALLDGYFGDERQLAPEDRFLKQYILNKGWVDHGDVSSDSEGGDEFAEVDAEDEAYLEAAEKFEHRYNFRFEEPGGAQIVTYPRQLEGTVRREDERRTRKRREKAERLAAEEEVRRGEVRRLKNLKGQEIEDRLHEVQKVVGSSAPAPELLDALVGNGDFDPEQYDAQMAAAFGDNYYGAEEGDDDLEDVAFEQEMEAIAQYGSEDEHDGTTFAALHRRLAEERRHDKAAGSGSDGEGAGEGAGEGEEEEGGEGGRESAARARAEVMRLLEEYYKLDYEDVVGGVKTRFRYKEVPADNYGLSVEEILGMEDRELNQVAGLKMLAPYREEHKKFRPNYGKLQELRREKGVGGPGDRQAWGRPQQQQGRGRQQQYDRERGGGGASRWQQQQQQQSGGGEHKKRRVQHAGGQEEEASQQVPKTEAERRLESYAKPTLRRPQGQGRGGKGGSSTGQAGSAGRGGGKKRMHGEQQPGGGGEQQQKQSEGPQLSKAQRKNLQRAKKRAEKRTGGADAADA